MRRQVLLQRHRREVERLEKELAAAHLCIHNLRRDRADLVSAFERINMWKATIANNRSDNTIEFRCVMRVDKQVSYIPLEELARGMAYRFEAELRRNPELQCAVRSEGFMFSAHPEGF